MLLYQQHLLVVQEQEGQIYAFSPFIVRIISISTWTDTIAQARTLKTLVRCGEASLATVRQAPAAVKNGQQ